jgi:5'-nucleotidase
MINIFIDMDGTICDYKGAYEAEVSESNPYPQSRVGFFTDLNIFDGAKQAILELDSNSDYKVWFLTRPSYMNLHCYSEKAQWVKTHFGQDWVSRLILCPEKSLVGKSERDILIDDNGDDGQPEFIGTWTRYTGQDWYNYTEWVLCKCYCDDGVYTDIEGYEQLCSRCRGGGKCNNI